MPDRGDIVAKIKTFLATNPSEEEIELFCVNEMLPYEKRSINEILKKEDENDGDKE